MKVNDRDIYIAPSIERADWLNFEDEIRKLEAAKVDILHIDIMDRTYGNTILLSPEIIPKIKKVTTVPLDIHLYVAEPEVYFPMLFDCCKDDYISLEIEAVNEVSRLLALIKSNGCKPAVSLELGTPLCFIEPILEQVEMVNLLVRNSGFTNIELSKAVLDRVAEVKEMTQSIQEDILLEVDGSINFKDTAALVSHGADVIVYGTKVIFREKITYQESMAELEEYLANHLN